MCNHVIWVYFKVSKMNLTLTFPWNALGDVVKLSQ